MSVSEEGNKPVFPGGLGALGVRWLDSLPVPVDDEGMAKIPVMTEDFSPDPESLPWGEMPYDSKTPAMVVHDYVMVRGDLEDPVARDQLARWIERYAAEAARAARAEAVRETASTLTEVADELDRIVRVWKDSSQ